MIEFRNVTKSYGDFTAVEDISFSACDSSVCGLIGYNGAGKTTLIKCAAGLYKPDSGKVLIDGESTYNFDEVRSRLFFVPDDLFFPVGSTRTARLASTKTTTRSFHSATSSVC